MNADHDLDRQLDAFLRDGPTRLHDASFDAVRDHIDQTRQRVALGPWRKTTDMNKLVTIALGAAAVVAVFIGIQLLGPAAPAGVGGAPAPTPTPTASSSTTSISGSAQFEMDLVPTTTEVDAVTDGASVSGTAVTTSDRGTHTVALECATRDGDTWALAGTIEETTVAGERAGGWSAVLVRDGPPQQIGIWLSDTKTDGVDCDGWLAGIAFATVDPENFNAVESGALVPPPDPAP